MKALFALFVRFSLLVLLLSSTACRRNQGGEGALADDLYSDELGQFTQFDDFDDLGLPGDRGDISSMRPVDSSEFSPVYFAFDSYSVAPGETSKIQAVASHLRSNPSRAVVLEGHTDERGSREYNLALGERRALAVRDVLLNMGIPASRMQTLSYGEEMPAVHGNDETAFARNRRVVFQIMQ